MSADVMGKRTTSEGFVDEENHADGPRKRHTTTNQDRHPIKQQPSSSIYPPKRPDSVLLSPAILHGDSENVQELEFYTYKPLCSDQMRLIHLHSGHGDEPIHCSLVIDSITSPSLYEALSYAWGEPHPAQKILLSDEEPACSFTTPRISLATPNLYDALKNIRMSDRPVVLWVDALCIDQKNTAEKNHQVRLMSNIYSNAHRVLVWLGNDTASTAWAISNVRGILNLDAPLGTTPDTSYGAGSTSLALCTVWNQYALSPWFERTWVLQEIVFARRTTFLRGRSELDSQDLRLIVDLILQHLSSSHDSELDLAQSGPQFQLEKSDFRAVRLAANLFKLTSDSIERSADGLEVVGRKRSLLQMIRETSHSQATDPRDKIFALLDIVSPNSAGSSISADYNLSLAQVSGQVVEREIEDSQSLDILTTPWAPRMIRGDGWATGTDIEELDDWAGSRPSWVAQGCGGGQGIRDHTETHRTPLRKLSSRDVRRRNGPRFSGMIQPFAASKDYAPAVRFQPCAPSLSFVPRKRSKRSWLYKPPNERPKPADETESTYNPRAIKNSVLVASGIEVGTITDVSMRMAGGIVSRDVLEMAGMSFSEGYEAVQNKPRELWDRLWRILVADRDIAGFAAPTSFGLTFFKLFKQILRLRCIDTEEMLKTETDHKAVEFLSRVQDVVLDRRMFSSSGLNHYEETLIGLVPREAQSGDKIIILFGGSVPLVIRPAKDNYVKIVGEAYVHGKMHGEAFHGLSGKELMERTQEFQIV